uniref:AAA ATPase domain-containing protein n=1 Tax=Candidatus Kentrum sp. FM TaxID=2126340 RepID=A0A450T6Z9_9GAMM|nr:MAG: AAA ATPase domain-containing protein [Candidatus Kentron sp. FM]VFJ62519.1 MAG: AAA ATPase domain-containing protein [Candidatus Kentron sp. FM]VFK13286.1 MAG: AAA ATPase domain-containing protein [Candidatus Kentron sp. FM]
MTNTTSFQARLGNKANPGFLPETDRLARIETGDNPFVSHGELPENSPVFFGRGYVMDEILSSLCHPDKPRCVSLLGERRMGKSSVLNQIFAALGTEEGLIAIRGNVQGWRGYTPGRFFSDLYRAIANVIPDVLPAEVVFPADLAADAAADEPTGEPDAPPGADYRTFLDALFPRANRYRFVLILDEFEAMLGNPNFDAEFFANLRYLGDTPQLRFGHLIASRRSLLELREHHEAFDSSEFRDIFGLAHVLGLLQPGEGQALTQKPWQRSLGSSLPYKETGQLEHRAGSHPALLQMVLNRMWQARAGKGEFDSDGIKQELWEYFRDLWENHSQGEKEVLVRILGGKPVTEHILSRDLRSRGLIIRKDREDALFAGFFEEFIRELLPADPALSRIMQERADEPAAASGKEPERAKKWLGGIFKKVFSR